MASMVFLALVSILHGVMAENSGSGLGSLNLTPQNNRILVFWTSFGREPYPTHLGRITNRSVESFILEVAVAGDALAECSRVTRSKHGIIITGFGEGDWYHRVPWEKTETDLRQLLRCLKESGAIVVYTSTLSDPVAQAGYGFGYQPFNALCREEEVVLITDLLLDICTDDSEPGRLVFKPYLDSGDHIHPSEEGYSVMAERTAQGLLDTGLVQTIQIGGELSGQIPAMLSHAMDLINAMEEKGADIQLAMEHYYLAEYLYQNRYYYTANWSLYERIIEPLETCLAGWSQTMELFDAANASITATEEAGMSREAILMEADYSRAQKAWNEYDSDTARKYLDKVLSASEPEQALLAILLAVLLFALSQNRPRRDSPGAMMKGAQTQRLGTGMMENE
jgi:hypothetical protein